MRSSRLTVGRQGGLALKTEVMPFGLLQFLILGHIYDCSGHLSDPNRQKFIDFGLDLSIIHCFEIRGGFKVQNAALR